MDQQLTKASSNPELGEYEGSVGTYPRVLHGSFSCFPGFSLVLDPRSRLGGLGRKVGCACEEFDICEGGILMFLRVLVSDHLGCPG